MAKSKQVKEAEVYTGLPQRVAELETLVKDHENRILELEMKCAPLYSIDIDLLFREFWSLRLMFCCTVNAFNLRAIGRRNPKYEKAARNTEDSANVAIGEMALADDPIEIGRKWYAKMKSRMEKLGIVDAFTEPPENIFPKSKQEGEAEL